MRLADVDGRGDIVDSRMLVQRVADRDDRSAVAPAHAGRPNDAHPFAEPAAQARRAAAPRRPARS